MSTRQEPDPFEGLPWHLDPKTITAPGGSRYTPDWSTMTGYTPPLSTEDLRPWMIGRTCLVDLPGRRPASHTHSTPSTIPSGVIESYEVGADRATLVRTTDKRAFSLDDYLVSVEIPPADTQPWQPPADPDLYGVREAVFAEIADGRSAERLRAFALKAAVSSMIPIEANASSGDQQGFDTILLDRARVLHEWIIGPSIDLALAEADEDLMDPIAREFALNMHDRGDLMALVSIAQEIDHARGKGYTPEHDDRHGSLHLRDEIIRRTQAMNVGGDWGPYANLMREIAGIAVAGMQLAERRLAEQRPAAPRYNAEGKRMIRDEPQG